MQIRDPETDNAPNEVPRLTAKRMAQEMEEDNAAATDLAGPHLLGVSGGLDDAGNARPLKVDSKEDEDRKMSDSSRMERFHTFIYCSHYFKIEVFDELWPAMEYGIHCSYRIKARRLFMVNCRNFKNKTLDTFVVSLFLSRLSNYLHFAIYPVFT